MTEKSSNSISHPSWQSFIESISSCLEAMFYFFRPIKIFYLTEYTETDI